MLCKGESRSNKIAEKDTFESVKKKPQQDSVSPLSLLSLPVHLLRTQGRAEIVCNLTPGTSLTMGRVNQQQGASQIHLLHLKEEQILMLISNVAF
ncbi:hypothetical protein CEXT_269751 [Caerostris extrusa]|uniref:Uncharacterized protein n=1 Tax=Caerostris extrusa TaxID=172846 RepID=A0AAV4PK85_CAEEX|nr:hypothetical protein CEXT_269751 [Caerostris extrusa]